MQNVRLRKDSLHSQLAGQLARLLSRLLRQIRQPLQPTCSHQVLPVSRLRLQPGPALRLNSSVVIVVWQLHVGHVTSLLQPGPHPLELTQQPLLHAERILYRRGEPAVRQGTHGTASIRCFIRAGQAAAPAIILNNQHHHPTNNIYTHIPHSTIYHHATQSYATQYETIRNHPTITCYTVLVLLKQAHFLLPHFLFPLSCIKTDVTRSTVYP